MHQLAPGPHEWVSSQDLHLLKESFGLAASFQNLDWVSKAAQIRVWHCDAGCLPSSHFRSRVKTLEQNIAAPSCDESPLGWGRWYAMIFSQTIHRTCTEVMGEAGSIEAIRKARLSNQTLHAHDRTWKRQVQRTIYDFLAAKNLMDPATRIRAKYERWNLVPQSLMPLAPPLEITGTIRQQTPAWQAARAAWLLRQLQGLVPARVQSTVFSTMWNRWTTARRYQSRGPCLLGCGCLEGDAIEHYCRCPVTRDICCRRLRLNPNVFATLQAFLLVHPQIGWKEDLVMLGLLHYAIYSVTNARRQKHTERRLETAFAAVAQRIMEGAKGHGKASAVPGNR